MSNYKSPTKRVSYLPGITHVGFASSGPEKVASAQARESSRGEHRRSSVGRRQRDVTAWAHTGAAQSLALPTAAQRPQCDPGGALACLRQQLPSFASHEQTLHSIVRGES